MMSFELFFKKLNITVLFWFFWIGYFSLALLFNTERILYMDSAYQLFEIVNAESFFFPAERYAVVLAHWPVVVASKLHLPLTFIIPLFSLCFPLLFLFIWLIIRFYLKDVLVSIVFIMSVLIGVTHLFFYPVTETYQAICWSLLVLALFRKERKYNFIDYFLLLTSLLSALFAHPVSLLMIACYLLFFLAENWYQRRGKVGLSLAVFTLLLLAFLAKKIMIRAGSYEDSFMPEPSEFFSRLVHIGDSFTLQYLMLRIYKMYLPVVVMIGSLIFVLRHKRKQMLFFLIAVLGVGLFLSIIYYTPDSEVMSQRALLPLTSLLVLLFIAYWQKEKQRYPILMLYGFTFFAFAVIAVTSLFYSKRLHKLDEYIVTASKENKQKVIISSTALDPREYGVTWALSEETLLRSFQLGVQPVTLFAVESDQVIPENTEEIFLKTGFDLIIPYYLLNSYYFSFRKEPYRKE